MLWMSAWRTYFRFSAGWPCGPCCRSMCSKKYPGPDWTRYELFRRISTIWSCGCGSVTWISFERSDWNSDAVFGM